MKPRDMNDTLPAAASAERRIDEIARRLVQSAARSAPESLSERLEEEWLAHLESRRGRMAQILFGIGCCWATRRIACDYCEAKMPAASAATAQKVMTVYAGPDPSVFSSRTTTFLIIAALHVLLIYALQSLLGHRTADIIPQALQVDFMKEQQKTNDPPPPPPQPQFVRPPIDIAVPDFSVDVPAGPDAIQPEVVAQRDTQPVPPAPQRTVKRVTGGPGKGFPATDDYYPIVSRRLGEEGSAIVNVCVNDRGRLTAGPTIAQSSGSPRLDDGALTLAKAGSGRYRATTEDGQPVSSCYAFRVKFDLR
jgi:protein TonB